AHPRPAGELGLAELVAGGQRAVHDRLAELVGDQLRGGPPRHRMELSWGRHLLVRGAPACTPVVGPGLISDQCGRARAARPARSVRSARYGPFCLLRSVRAAYAGRGAVPAGAGVRNRVPSPSRGSVSPASRSPCQTLTWLAVSTGLPTRRSSSSRIAALCSAVSGTSTASASACSAEATQSSTSAAASVPTSAAVTMPRPVQDATPIPACARKSANREATSSG